MSINRITVYAASSRSLDPVYFDAAARLGRELGRFGLEIAYGGGGAGLMGAMADAAIAAGGRVYGYIPEFLMKLERGHPELSALEVVPDMRTRKERMLSGSDAVVALPGGPGTLEEVFEVMTLKRLGGFHGPILLVNTGGYYDGLLDFLHACAQARFMDSAQLELWRTVSEPESVPVALGLLADPPQAVRPAPAQPVRQCA